MWEQISGAAKLQADHMNNYYEAMVHQGEATSPSARQIDLVRTCAVHVSREDDAARCLADLKLCSQASSFILCSELL